MRRPRNRMINDPSRRNKISFFAISAILICSQPFDLKRRHRISPRAAICPRQQSLASLAHLLNRHRKNAPRLIKRVAPIALARMARKVILHHAMPLFPRPPMHRTTRSKNNHRRRPRSRSKMRRSSIVSQENPRPRDQSNQQSQIKRLKDHSARTRTNSLAHRRSNLIFARTQNHHRTNPPRLHQPSRNLSKMLHRPALSKITPTRLNHSVSLTRRNSLPAQNFGDPVTRISPRKNRSPRNRPARQTRPIKLRHPLLNGMHLHRPIKFHCIRRQHIVKKIKLLALPTNARRRPRSCRQESAPRSAMLIKNHRKFSPPQIPSRRSKSPRN